jgi:hypothetical protein
MIKSNVISSGFSLKKWNFVAVVFAMISLLSLICVCPSVFADEASLTAYQTACGNLNSIEFYPYDATEQGSADGTMSSYITARSAVSFEDYDSVSEENYSKLYAQKSSLANYYSASNAILEIITYSADTVAANTAMSNFYSARTTLITNYGDTPIMQYVNIASADAKYGVLLSEKSNYLVVLTKPYAISNSYVYSGNQLRFALSSNFDGSLMTVTNNIQTEANESGYDVVVSLKDKETYCWKGGYTDDLHFLFVISKKSVTESEVEGISFDSVDSTYSGLSKTIFISTENFGTLGISLDSFSVNGDEISGSSFSAQNAGTYVATARLVTDSNHIFELENGTKQTSVQLTATLTIKPLTLTSNGVTIAYQNGFDAQSSFYVLTSSATEKANLNTWLRERDVLAKNEEIKCAYETYLVKDGDEVQPSDDVLVMITIPQNLRGLDFKIFELTSVSENVSLSSQVSFVSSGDSVSFETDELATYAFVYTVSSGMSAWGIVGIVLVSLLVLLVLAVLVLYFVWKNTGKSKIKFLVPMFKKTNKMFHGTELNDVELVEEGKKLLKQANERQKFDVEQKIKKIEDKKSDKINGDKTGKSGK